MSTDKEFHSFMTEALLAEQSGKFDEAEGFYNDAITAASARGSIEDCAACYFQLALFFDRRERTQEAANVRRIADLIQRKKE